LGCVLLKVCGFQPRRKAETFKSSREAAA